MTAWSYANNISMYRQMKTLFFVILFFSLISPVFVQAQSCTLAGDAPPCGVISLAEVIDFINQWATGNASLSDVIGLISAWSMPQESVSNKPVVELFVMSHCPYGLQIEKGFIPVLDALNGSINFSVRFCSYSMHGRKEIDEELLQHCIEKEHTDRYIPYLRCFLEAGNTTGCLNRTSLSASDLAGCIGSTDSEYNVSADYNNGSTWLYGMFPPFGVDSEQDAKYDVSASPTLVVNSTVVDTGRDPKSLLGTVCAAFAVKPTACGANLSNETPAPGFGFIDRGNNQSGSC